MELFSKSLLNGFSLLGGCCAFSVPVAMHSIGGGSEAREVALSYCDIVDSENVKEINYGVKGTKKVCWFAKPKDQSSPAETNREEFTELFKKNWNKSTENNPEWSFDSQSKWKQQCEGITSPWNTFSSESNVERLGLCKNNDQKETPFVKKQKSKEGDNETFKLWICDKECWETSSPATVIGGSSMLQQEKKDNWKEVKFRQKR